MEICQKQCQKCSSISEELHDFSCGHALCTSCISRKLFFRHLNQIASQDLIHIECNCHSGYSIFSIEKIYNTLSKTHKSGMSGRNEHYQACKYHHVHQKEFYCLNCQEEICRKCRDENHFKHIFETIEDHANKLKSQIHFHKYSSISDVLNRLDQSSSLFKSNMQNAIAQFDQLIRLIEEYKAKYMCQIMEVIERTEIFSEIFKLLYSNFLSDFMNSLRSQDISFIQEITSIPSDFSKYKLEIQEQNGAILDTVKQSIQTFTQLFNQNAHPLHLSWKIHRSLKKYQTLTGHENAVTSIIQLKDGRIASGSNDTAIIIWEANDKEFKKSMTLTGHIHFVRALIQLRDGTIASGSYDSTIKLWDISQCDASSKFTLTGHSKAVLALLQLKDGRLASGSSDTTIKIWDVTENLCRESLTLKGHTHSVMTLIQLQDGRIASGSVDTTIILWEVKRNSLISSVTLKGHCNTVLTLLQLSDGRIASGSWDKTIKIWKSSEKSEYWSSQSESVQHSAVSSMVEIEEGKIISGSGDGTIQLWDINLGEELTLGTQGSSITSLVYLNDGRMACGSGDRTITIWE